MFLLTICLVLLNLIDSTAIIGGFFEIPFYYWYSDANGTLLLFRDEVLDNYEVSFIGSRNWIITFVYFSAAWTAFAAASTRYFGKRRYGASSWPLNLWKIATFLLIMRIIAMSIVVQKFHHEIIEFESFDQLINLYTDGIIGLIPAILFLSIILNVAIVIGSILTIMNTSEWYRLNVAKRL